jgi:periplasmic protein TonB
MSVALAQPALSLSDLRRGDARYAPRSRATIRFAAICAAHALAFFLLWNVVVESKPVTLIRASLLAVEIPSENIVEPTPKVVAQKTLSAPKPTPTVAVKERTIDMAKEPEVAFVPPVEIAVVPSATAASATTTTPPASMPPTSAPTATAVVTAPAKPKIELPSSSADYLTNPAPPYPPISKRLKEQGRVLLRVFVSIEGDAERVELRQSSGFERLDQVAMDTVKRWKFVPGKRDGTLEAMWVTVPIVFELTS